MAAASQDDGARLRDLLAQTALSPLDRRILEFYALHFGRFVAHERVIQAVYGHDPDGGPDNPDNVIKVRISNLRSQLATLGLAFEATTGSRRLVTAPGSSIRKVVPMRPPAPAPTAAAPAEAKKPTRAELATDAIVLGEADGGWPIGIDLAKLLETRLLVQGSSGAGKSWTLRRLLEQTAGRIQQVIIDPEGEFKGLAEDYGHLMLEAQLLDAAALATAARRVREHRVSVLLDLSQMVGRESQMAAVAAFFFALVDAPREHWHPALVAVDEAHLFAPFGGSAGESSAVRKEAIAAVVDLMSRGRKRGLCGILATQRLARLSKSVASEVQNFLIGLNTLDLDIRRAAETIGWDARRAFDRLPALTPGRFVAVGPAFSDTPATLKVGAVATMHWGAAPVMTPPATVAQDEAARLLSLDALIEASAADQAIREENARSPGFLAVRAFLRDPAFGDAARIFAGLVALAPNGAAVAELGPVFEIEPDRVAAALALLDVHGALEFSGEAEERAVRLERGMRQAVEKAGG